MRALCLTAPKQFEFQHLPEPPKPGPGEALVAVRAAGICGTDLSGYLGKMPFIQCPRILGHELAVEVLATGPHVSRVQTGDRCSVEPYLHCGTCPPCRQGKTNCCEILQVLGVHRDGGFVERMLLPVDKLHPANALQDESLALIETLAIGCHAVERSLLTPEETVLIFGAGPIGLSVLEFASLKTQNIIVVDPDEKRRHFVRQHFPGITKVLAAPPESTAQVLFDATGNAQSMTRSLESASFGGRIVFVGITTTPVMLDDPLFHRRELTLLASRNALAADFPRIQQLVASKQIDVSRWIGCETEFGDTPQLFSDLISGRVRGVKAVVKMGVAE